MQIEIIEAAYLYPPNFTLLLLLLYPRGRGRNTTNFWLKYNPLLCCLSSKRVLGVPAWNRGRKIHMLVQRDKEIRFQNKLLLGSFPFRPTFF